VEVCKIYDILVIVMPMILFVKKYKMEFLSVAVTAVVAYINFFFSSLVYATDDQFILFRYIDNIAMGNGFVYNIGEKVLGATTPLFTLVVAFFKYIFISVSTPVIVANLNILFLSVSALFFYRVSRNFLSEKFSLLAVLIFALSLFKTIPEGMESPLFILTLFIFLDFLLQGRYYLSAIFLSLTILTRPDAGLIAILVAIFWWQKTGIVKTIRLISLCVAVALPWMVFSTIYFGSFIPESLVAKSHISVIVNQSSFQAFKVQLASLSRIYWGSIKDIDNIFVQVVFNLIPFLVLVYLGVKEKLNKNTWIVFSIPFLYFIFFSLSNPVMWPWYFSQTEPLWILISIIGVSYIWRKINYFYIKIALIVLILIGPAIFWWGRVTIPNLPNEEGLGMVNYLKENVKKGEKIGINNIGGVGYFTNAYIIDFFGIINDYAYAFYPVESKCANKNLQYLIPPNLVVFTKPDWLMIGGEGELDKCFMEGKWFKKNYKPAIIDGVPSKLVWKLKK
jgi:hypothetical protein